MELLKLLVSNYFIDVAVISWFSAQLIKTLLFYLQNGILQAERMVGAGGMPSAHSAFVCSITIAIAKRWAIPRRNLPLRWHLPAW